MPPVFKPDGRIEGQKNGDRKMQNVCANLYFSVLIFLSGSFYPWYCPAIRGDNPFFAQSKNAHSLTTK